MKSSFFERQSKGDKEKYIELLKITGSLSNLFSESENPFLYYRAMENIFCISFGANNLSRSDISVDAGKNGIGIGLKTFLQSNGKTFQKVAEFNKESYLLQKLDGKDLIYRVSEMRNDRIETTKRICDIDKVMYHLITRSKNKMAIYEENMDFIDINKIKILNQKNSTIHFTDNIHEYNFSLSKTTLLKRFDTSLNKKIIDFEVKIIENPFDYLLNLKQKDYFENTKMKDKIVDYIVLPLYSPRSGKVEECSGLNQWNAGGRQRNLDEVYINFPIWIHKAKEGFFEYNTGDHKTSSFDVKLPNGKILSMKIAQQNGKALMSNPNKALGKWILRDILKIPYEKLVKKEDLDKIGIDSVKLSKTENGKYLLDFCKLGSYEDFFEKNN